MIRLWLILAALLGGSAVALGAFHAHGLESFLAEKGLPSEELPEQLHNCDVAVRYQIYHAVALLGVTTLLAVTRNGMLNIVCFHFVGGVVLFSGGLYAMVFAGQILHWAIVPAGGLILILGWLTLLLTSFAIRFADF